MNWLKNHSLKDKTGVAIFLYIRPGASKTRVQGLHQDRLKISVQSPPVEGAANEALIEFLKKILGKSKSKIHLIAGKTSPLKTIWLEEASIDEVKTALETAMSKK